MLSQGRERWKTVVRGGWGEEKVTWDCPAPASHGAARRHPVTSWGTWMVLDRPFRELCLGTVHLREGRVSFLPLVKVGFMEVYLPFPLGCHLPPTDATVMWQFTPEALSVLLESGQMCRFSPQPWPL